MSKKLLAILLAVCMLVCLLPTMAMAADATNEAKIGEDEYATLAAAVEAADAGDTVKLLKDVDLSTHVIVGKTLTIDLNGNKIFNSADIWKTSVELKVVSLIRVSTGGDLTITDTSAEKKGAIVAKENDCYAVNADGGNLTIEAGEFVGNLSAIQAAHESTVYIKGGTYKILQKMEDGGGAYRYLLNLYDNTGREFVVTGGSFYGQNPEDTNSEPNSGSDFVPEYCTTTSEVKDGVTVYTVTDNREAENTTTGTKYDTLAEAVGAAANGDTITLLDDVALTGYVTIDKALTLDLNGKTIARPSKGGENLLALYVNAGDGKTVTLTGNGTVSGDLAVWAQSGTVVIENGTYTGDDSHAIYAKGTGKVVINGGTFSTGEGHYVLNKYDAERGNTSITVYGGTFANFNPADCGAEGNPTNFVADGYVSIQDGDNYVVEEGVMVAGILVTSENAANITGSGISGTVSYNAGTKTLTLTGATITAPDGNYGIFANHDLTIVGEGTSSITGAPGKAGIKVAGNLTLNGTFGTIACESTEEEEAYVIFSVGGDLTIAEGAAIESVVSTGDDSIGIATYGGDITIAGTVNTITAGTPIFAAGDITVAVTGVTLSESSKSLTAGGSFTLTATVAPDYAPDKTVTWTSSDEAVATVDENGKVTAKAAGTATITATAGGKTAECAVTVSNPPAPPVYVPTTPPAPVEPETPSVDTSAPVVDSTVTENADGSSTKTETLENGVVVETTTNTDGSTVTAATKTEETAQGTVTTTETAMSNGSKGTTTVDETGKVEAEVTVSAAAKSAAAAADAPVALPMPAVEASADSETAATVKVDLPAGTASATVAIPVAENTGAGTVAVIVNADGSETVITDSIVTENGLEVEVPDGATIKVVDNSTAFTDVPASNWAKNAVDFASARSIMQGTSTGENATFAPNTATTRAMVWTMLARLSGADTAPGEGQTWYDKGQEWAMANGISDGTNADGEITREQLASMLHRYVGKPASNQDLSKFNDHEKTSDWAQTAKQWAVEMGVIGGKGNADGSLSLDPTGDASRAEVAQMLMNFIKAMSKKG